MPGVGPCDEPLGDIARQTHVAIPRQTRRAPAASRRPPRPDRPAAVGPGGAPLRHSRGRPARRRGPPSEAAADRAASRFGGSVGTTPSIIAWSWVSSTVAGVARSWAMSLAARRRSISERSSRSAIALNASASSADFEVVAAGRAGVRLARFEPPCRRGHVAQRPGQSTGDRRSTRARSRSRSTRPATIRVTLNSGRKPRSVPRTGQRRLKRRD